MAIDYFGEHVGEITKRYNVIEFCGFDERGDGRPVLGPRIGACKQRVLAIEGNRPDGSLDMIGRLFTCRAVLRSVCVRPRISSSIL